MENTFHTNKIVTFDHNRNLTNNNSYNPRVVSYQHMHTNATSGDRKVTFGPA